MLDNYRFGIEEEYFVLQMLGASLLHLYSLLLVSIRFVYQWQFLPETIHTAFYSCCKFRFLAC